jgi:hypothetical protein
MSDHFRANFSVVLPANRSDVFFFNTRVYRVSEAVGDKSESEVASLWCALIDRGSVALGTSDGPDLLR